jgi:hypothetical protein
MVERKKTGRAKARKAVSAPLIHDFLILKHYESTNGSSVNLTRITTNLFFTYQEIYWMGILHVSR